MALGYWRHCGESRDQILVMENGYHGDTIGAMSVGARGVFNQAYEPLLFDVKSIPFPDENAIQHTLDALQQACSNSIKPAAFIVEPLILGAGGMLMYPAHVLREMYQICQKHDVLFIADEVMTGWGRTGTLFACEQADIVPDIVCYSKGLTGGSIPLAVTMCGGMIFDAHYSQDRSQMFFHSSSYTANPIACAAASENLKIWQQEPVLGQIKTLALKQDECLAKMRQLPNLENIRRTGIITAMDVVTVNQGYLSELAPTMTEYFQKNGILLRPLGNTIYVMPPYCVTQSDLTAIYDCIEACVKEISVN